MARKRRRSRPALTAHSAPSAADIDPAKSTIEGLIAAIVALNPTGRDLPAGEAAARYRDKNRLQGELITRFSADLSVWPDERDPRLVLLADRRTGRTAGHAVVADLSDEARSWVQRQLDLGLAAPPDRTGASLAPAESTPRGPAARRGQPAKTTRLSAGALSDVQAALDRGERALQTYEYEGAREAFDEALRVSGGAVQPARALLTLLVDHLAADVAALEVGGRLPRDTREDVEVAGLLLVAEARGGAGTPSFDLLRRVGSRRRAEALVLLCQRALSQERLDEAKRWLDEVEELRPVPEEASSLRRRWREAREARRRPAERALQSAADEIDDDALESRARRLLERFRDSDVARRLLRGVQRRREERARRELVARARAALGAGEFELALSRFKAAMAAGAREPEVEAGAQAARRGLEERRREKQTARVVALLERDEAGGLLAWLELDDDARARHPRLHPACPLLQGAGIKGGGGGARAAVAGALAVLRARGLLASGEAEGALQALLPEEEAVRDLPGGAELLASARKEAAQQLESRALERLVEAEAALVSGDLDRAAALLDPRAHPTPASLQEQAGELTTRLALARERRKQRRLADAARQRGDLLGARARLLRLAAAGGDRSALDEELSALDAQVRTSVMLWAPQGDLGTLPQDAFTALYARESPHLLLHEDGRHAVVPSSHGAWCFIHVVDLETSRVVRAAVLRSPTDAPFRWVSLDGERLLLLGNGSPELLEIDVRDWTLHRRCVLPRELQKDVEVLDLLVCPDGGPVWANVEQSRQHRRVYTLDRDTLRIRRRLPAALGLHGVFRGGDDLIVTSDDDARVYGRDGHPRFSFKDETIDWISGATCAPDGQGLVLYGGHHEGVAACDCAMVCFLLDDHGRERSRIELEDIDYEIHHLAAAAQGEGGLYLMGGREINLQLVAVHAAGGELRQTWRREVDLNSALLIDARGQRVCAAVPQGDALKLWMLDRTPPDLEPQPQRQRHGLVFDHVFLTMMNAQRSAPAFEFDCLNQDNPDRQAVLREVQSTVQGHAEEPQRARSLYRKMSGRKEPVFAEALRAMEAALADDPTIAFELAVRAALQQRWARVREALQGALPALDGEDRDMAVTLLCLACLRLNDDKGARAALKVHTNPSEETHSLLKAYLRACRRHSRPPGELKHSHLYVALAHCIGWAHRLRETGRPEEAMALLAQSDFLATKEVQSQAVRVLCHLDRPARSDAGLLAEARDCARLAEMVRSFGETYSQVMDLPIPGVSLDRATLEALARQATARLEAIATQRDGRARPVAKLQAAGSPGEMTDPEEAPGSTGDGESPVDLRGDARGGADSDRDAPGHDRATAPPEGGGRPGARGREQSPGATRSKRSAGACALELLLRHREEEMQVEGLWQLCEGAHTRGALRQALHRLHRQGLVVPERDGRRQTWWAITKAGIEAGDGTGQTP